MSISGKLEIDAAPQDEGCCFGYFPYTNAGSSKFVFGISSFSLQALAEASYSWTVTVAGAPVDLVVTDPGSGC